jgi:hypothetical protein
VPGRAQHHAGHGGDLQAAHTAKNIAWAGRLCKVAAQDGFHDAAFVRMRRAVKARASAGDQAGRLGRKRGSHDAGGGGIANAHFADCDQVVSFGEGRIRHR